MSLCVPPKDGDWTGVRKGFRQISRALEDYSFYGLTASRLLSTNTLGKPSTVSDLTTWIGGTTNRVTVADDGDGTITLSGPQDIHTGASPTWAGATLSGLTASRLVASDASKGLVSSDLIGWVGTGSADRLSVVDDADGTITLDLGANTQTLLDSFNGIFLETIDFTISESGGTVTGSLEQDGTGDLTQRFSDGYSTLDCTPAKTIDLTAYVGTDAVPKEVFVYILQSGKTTLVASNTDWPATEHIKIANLVLKSAATTGTDGGAIANRNWNDHTQGTNSQGHITHIEQRLRQNHAAYESGVALTLKDSTGATMSTTDSSTAIELVTSEGSVYQLHKQTFPATDMYATAADDAHVVNQPTDEGGGYETTVDLVTDVTHYVDGSAAGVAIGSNKFFNLVIWGVQNKSGEVSHIMINLPTGVYNTEADAIADSDGTSVFDIPNAFKGLGFLIARLTFKLIAGPQWTYIAIEDLRGKFPGVSAGIGVSTTDHGLLSGLADDDHTQYLLADGMRALAGAWDLGGYDLTNGGVLFLTEQAAAEADVAGKGQIWVKTATPNTLWFTNDAGTDVQLGVGGVDVKCAVDSAATGDYLGAASSDGILRTGSKLSYTDGGNYVTIDSVLGRKFSAYQATADVQAIATGTYTKLLFPSEAWDVGGEFASSRFTPTSAGYYRASMGVTLLSMADGNYIEAGIYKNTIFNAEIARNAITMGAAQSFAINATRVFYLNGTTDYLECYVFHNYGSNRNTQGNDTYKSTFFDAEREG